MMYDVIVIGGGSAGLMAGIAASARGAKVLLADKGDKLGRKLGISGGGRCNVTNNKDLEDLVKHIPGNGRFLYSAFAVFGNREIIAFFEKLGIPLKEEDNGRMFPVTDKAKTVVDALVAQVRRQGVEIRVNTPAEQVLYKDGHVAGVRFKNGQTVSGKAVIVAVGGKSVPHTGSTGDGYAWAEEAGHTITALFPTEVPLTSDEPIIRSRDWQGLSLRDAALTVWNAKGKKVVTHEGDLLFTHFGLSGPIALRCSQFVVKELAKQATVGSGGGSGGSASRKVLLTIDLHPGLTREEVYQETLQLAEQDPKKAVKNVLKSVVPERMLPYLLKKAGLNEQTTYDNIPRQNWIELSSLIKALPLHVNGTLSIEEAFVTGGGVNLKEITPGTMESKLVQGLYFCGEILDVHGYTGGYNITAAFATGYTAGMHAAEAVLNG